MCLRSALELRLLGIPDPHPLPDYDNDIPYSLAEDDALALRTLTMEPYHSNAFGISSHRWRCLINTIKLEPL